MPYFPLPGGFHSTPELLGASDAAVALYAKAASWSVHHLTDGHVPTAALPMLTASHEQGSAELVERKVWRRARGGFQFVAWPHQATRSNLEAQREASKRRQQNYRRSQGELSRRDKHVTNGVTDGVTNGVSHTPKTTRKRENSPNGESPHTPPTDRFDEFWTAYPRKDNKQAARKAWAKAVKRHGPDELITEAHRWAGLWQAAGTAKQYIPHGSTWLNGDRWTDEPPAERLRAVSGGWQPYQDPEDPFAAYTQGALGATKVTRYD